MRKRIAFLLTIGLIITSCGVNENKDEKYMEISKNEISESEKYSDDINRQESESESDINNTIIEDYTIETNENEQTTENASTEAETVVNEKIISKAIYDGEVENIGFVRTYDEIIYSISRPEIAVASVELEWLVLDERFKGAAKINRQIEEIQKQNVEFGKNMALEVEEWIDEITGANYCYSSIPMEISYFDNNYLSFCQEDYVYTGGAHGMPYWNGYTFDLHTGELLGLEAVISNSEEELQEIVTRYFAEMINKEPEFYWENAIDNVRKTVNFESLFYLTEGGIKFYYEPYALACYAAGFQEVIIPYDEFKMKIQVNS